MAGRMVGTLDDFDGPLTKFGKGVAKLRTGVGPRRRTDGAARERGHGSSRLPSARRNSLLNSRDTAAAPGSLPLIATYRNFI